MSTAARPATRAQITVGGTTVTYLPDGHAWADPTAFFPASTPADWAGLLDADGRFPVSIGAFLIRAADRVILVDLGLGPVEFSLPGIASFRGGRLLDSLAAEGLAPSDVDTVVFTHLHHDHVGWTSADAGLTFGAARHLVAEAEWRHWAGTAEPVGPDPATVQAPLEGRVEFMVGGQELAPGIRVVATPGHTPGHSSLLVTDPSGVDPRRVLVLGDVMHCQVQVAAADWSFAFDVDPAESVATRRRVLAELERPDTLVAGGHFADQVFGRVLTRRYQPVD